jgi:hypothetical protein
MPLNNQLDFSVHKEPKPRGAILILGYKRLEFLVNRVIEVNVSNVDKFPLFISIDGGGLSLEQIKKKFVECNLDDFIGLVEIQPINLSGVGHYFKAVGEKLNDYDWLIVLEDDVKVFPGSIIDLSSIINKVWKEDLPLCVNTFTPLSGSFVQRIFLGKNRWYPTRYFNCWGHAINRSFFMKLKAFYLMPNNETAFLESKKRGGEGILMSQRRRKIWSARLSRGTYDFIIQVFAFTSDFRFISPKFRISENVGFGDSYSTHTKLPRSKWLGRQINRQVRIHDETLLKSKLLLKFLEFINRLILAGDTIFTSRGREVGVRTYFKSLMKFVKNLTSFKLGKS